MNLYYLTSGNNDRSHPAPSQLKGFSKTMVFPIKIDNIRRCRIGVLTYDLQPFTEDLIFRLNSGLPEFIFCAYPCFFHQNQFNARFRFKPSKIKAKAFGFSSGRVREAFTSSVNIKTALKIALQNDIVLLYGLQGGTAILAAAMATVLRKPIVSVNHSLSPEMEGKRRLWVRLLKAWLLRRCAHHICQMPAAMKTLHQIYRIPDRDMTLAPFEGGAALFRPRVERSAELRRFGREQLGAKGKSLVFLMVGNLIPLKGPDLVIEALAKMDDENSHVVIVGPEEPGYGERGTISFYNEMARSLNIQERVHVVGAVQPSELAAFYSMADVFVLPTWKDCLPKVFIEAGIFRLPIITTSAPGSVGLLPEDGKNGLVIPIGDSDALSIAMNKMKDEPFRSACSTEAFNTVDSYCDGNAEVDGFCDALTKVAAEKFIRI